MNVLDVKNLQNIPTFQYQTISKIPFTQEKLLSNESNKYHLIKTLSKKLLSKGFICKQATEDVDFFIINIYCN